jgi:hypothetical protein
MPPPLEQPKAALPARPPLPDLELPEAPDFISRPRAMPLDRMLDLLEEYRQGFPALRRPRRRQAERCLAEFEL